MEIRYFKTINGNLRSRFHEIKVVKLMFQPRSGAQVQRDQHTQDSPFYRVDGSGARRTA